VTREKKKKALRLSSKGLVGRPKQSIIEPHLPGYEQINRVSGEKIIANLECYLTRKLDHTFII
jgi:hypothetical protein